MTNTINSYPVKTKDDRQDGITDEQVESLYLSGMNLRETGLAAGLTKQRVDQILDRLGTPRRRRGMAIDSIEYAYLELGMPLRAVAKRTGFDYGKVYRYLKKRNLLRSMAEAHAARRKRD